MIFRCRVGVVAQFLSSTIFSLKFSVALLYLVQSYLSSLVLLCLAKSTAYLFRLFGICVCQQRSSIVDGVIMVWSLQSVAIITICLRICLEFSNFDHERFLDKHCLGLQPKVLLRVIGREYSWTNSNQLLQWKSLHRTGEGGQCV